jgi:hypothetical protein
MALRNPIVFSIAILICWPASVSVADAAQGPDLSDRIRQRGMIFFVAKGEPNACGPGCSEWIAAEGAFDAGAQQRLRDLLSLLNGRELPIFFDSIGGFVGEAVAVGRILREHRMTAGIGATLPSDCRGAVATEPSCRTVIGSRQELTARLRLVGGQCYSACLYAFIGGSTRQVHAGARIAIHAAIPAPNVTVTPQQMEDVRISRKWYALEMGVDAGVVDAADKIPSDRVRILRPEEIARFGIETRRLFETPWLLYRDSSRRRFLLKSITQAIQTDRTEYRTGVISFSCKFKSYVLLSYRRELASSEIGYLAGFRLRGADGFAGNGMPGDRSVRWFQVITDLQVFRAAMAAPAFVLDESFSSFSQPGDAPISSRTLSLSTSGLAALLDEGLQECPLPRTSDPPGAAAKP